MSFWQSTVNLGSDIDIPGRRQAVSAARQPQVTGHDLANHKAGEGHL